MFDLPISEILPPQILGSRPQNHENDTLRFRRVQNKKLRKTGNSTLQGRQPFSVGSTLNFSRITVFYKIQGEILSRNLQKSKKSHFFRFCAFFAPNFWPIFDPNLNNFIGYLACLRFIRVLNRDRKKGPKITKKYCF